MDLRAVPAAEHPVQTTPSSQTHLLAKYVIFMPVLGSVHLTSYNALLPHSVWCTLSTPGLVALIISGLLNNGELRIWKAVMFIMPLLGLKPYLLSRAWCNGQGKVTPRLGFLPHQAAHLNRIVEDQRAGLGSDMTITQHQLNVLLRDTGSNKDYADADLP